MELTKKKLINIKDFKFRDMLKSVQVWRMKKTRRIVSVLLVIVALGLVGWLVYDKLTAPVKITEVHFERSLSSRTTDAPVKKDFVVSEPVMMVIEYSSAQPQTSAKLEIYKGKEKIRTVDLPYLRGDKTAPDNGKRYISIVNGSSTKLEAGEYTAKIIVNNKRIVLSEKLVVK